jgi:hypothetical protein
MYRQIPRKTKKNISLKFRFNQSSHEGDIKCDREIFKSLRL